MISAFGIDHGSVIRKDDISDQAKVALVSGMRNSGMAFQNKDARKQYRQNTRMAARTFRSGPYSAENRKRMGIGVGAGTAAGALLGAGAGALMHGGMGAAKGAKIGAAVGGVSGGASGADVASTVNWQKASMRGLDRSIKQGGVQTGVPKEQISRWTATRRPDQS